VAIGPPGEPTLKLSELPRRTAATVERVEDQMPNDAIARRLRELGFVQGERVEVMAAGPVSAEPLLVQVGFTRFALRRSEAARVRILLAVQATEQGA
jgi:ferrous iron transport protein A